MSAEEKIKAGIDIATGVSAATWPVWLQHVQMGVGLFMLFGGAVLLVVRLILAFRQLKK